MEHPTWCCGPDKRVPPSGPDKQIPPRVQYGDGSTFDAGSTWQLTDKQDAFTGRVPAIRHWEGAIRAAVQSRIRP